MIRFWVPQPILLIPKCINGVAQEERYNSEWFLHGDTIRGKLGQGNNQFPLFHVQFILLSFDLFVSGKKLLCQWLKLLKGQKITLRIAVCKINEMIAHAPIFNPSRLISGPHRSSGLKNTDCFTVVI